MARQPKPWYRADRDSYYVTIGGVRHKLGPDKKAAMTRFYELMNQPKAAQVASDAFVAIADCFLEWVQKNRAADTYEWYRYRLEQFANRCSGLRAADVRPYHVQQWVDSYSHLSQNSRRNLVRSVKRCLTWARQQGYIVENPIRDIEMPGQQSREVCFTVEQFEEMCSFIRDRTFLELCRVTFETGARPQEVLHVEVRHFDPEHVRWILPPSESKGKKRPRIVYLTPYAMEVTTRLAARYPEGKLFRNIEDVAWTTDAVNCAFTRLQLRMGKAAMKAKGIELESVLQPELDRADDVPVAKVKDLTAKQRSKIANRAVARFAVKCSLYALRHSWATRALQSPWPRSWGTPIQAPWRAFIATLGSIPLIFGSRSNAL